MLQGTIKEHDANNSLLQDEQETPDYSVRLKPPAFNPLCSKEERSYFTQDSDTNPNTTATSDAEASLQTDGRKRRIDATNLRKNVLGKKHSRLDESKACVPMNIMSFQCANKHVKTIGR